MQNQSNQISRRAALGMLGAGTAISMASSAHAAVPFIDDHALGWDSQRGEYTVPPLPYAYNALEPVIDEQTMRIHHSRHHAGYVRGLNNALNKLAQIRSGEGDPATLEHWQRELSFNAGGHVNHALFWSSMRAPRQDNRPQGELADALTRDFGSITGFLSHFRAASASVEGSGWGWLVLEPASGRLMVLQMHNQQQMMFAGAIPLLGVDVWEHAYYLNYQNRRADYLQAFERVINWDEISRRFGSAAS
ncbi:MAG: superoxide dismutase [Planctomycetota bacterium]